MSGQPYSVSKLVHHPEALQAMRDGKHQNPTQIHFMPALACNQACSFCLVAGTKVETTRGSIPIEDVQVGDRVVIGSETFRVRDCMSRWADNVMRLEVKGLAPTYLTQEHPIFTKQGFVESHELRAGHRVASDMRMRLRSPDNIVSSREQMEMECQERCGCRAQEDVKLLESDEGSRDSTQGLPLRLFSDGDDQNGEVVSRSLPGSQVHRTWSNVAGKTESRLPHTGEETLCGSDTTRGVQLLEDDFANGGELRHTHNSTLREEGMAVPGSLSSIPQAEGSNHFTEEGGRVLYQGREIRHLGFREVLNNQHIPGWFRVYNLSVETCEAFIANGILTHNCSYGHRTKDDGPDAFGWKNMELMSNEYMPRAKMLECIRDWKDMGVKAIEVTGGGEPLVYPHIDEFFEKAADWGVDIALVSNGTAMTPQRADLFARTNWKWARISIDAGDVATYASVRRVSRNHWDLAWAAVERLAARRKTDEQRVGIGYVVDAGNYGGVYDACRMADDYGADNVRISLAFTPQNLNRFPPGAIDVAIDQAEKAEKDFPELQINGLVRERKRNIELEAQDYKFCAVKEVLCVVGGDQRVYHCCVLAFNSKGLIGSIENQSFKQMWDSSAEWFKNHDARKICNVPCMYEGRNKRALELISMPPKQVANIAKTDPSIHRNFI